MTTDRFEKDILPIKHPIYRYALYLVKNKEDARDLTQEVLIKLWENREQLVRIENPRAWAMKMTRNRCLDWLKSPKRKGVEWKEDLDQRTDHHAQKQLEEKEQTQWVKKQLKRLPEMQQNVFYLRHFEENSYREIGDSLQIDETKVKVYLHRARTFMKKQIEQHNAYGLQTG